MSEPSKQENTYTYTYSARQQAEIKAIRSKYLPPEEDKMATLRRLDASAGQKGSTAALILGITSALILGIGMCCCMVFSERWFIPGIIIGLIGIAGITAAYPVYTFITRRERKRIAPQILKLTEELLK